MKIQQLIYTIVLVFFVNHAHAWSITPMVSTLTPEKRTMSITINNKGSKDMAAIKLSVQSRTQDINGNEIRTATKDLRIFPKQIIVQPDKIVNIRVLIVKPNKSTHEKSYRIIAEAVALKKDAEAGSGVQMLLKYVTSLYLPPRNENLVDLDIRSAKLSKDELILDVSNTSTQHQIMSVKEITTSVAGKEVSVDIEDKLFNVLSNSQINMHIPITPEEYGILKLNPIISFTNKCLSCDIFKKITLNVEQ